MEKLREICSKTFTPEEMQMLDRAIEFTKGVHAHQTRHSGEPYYTHPESVAIMLANMGMDSHTILAGLMHDVIEDGKDITYEKLASMFGQDIAGMNISITAMTAKVDKANQSIIQIQLSFDVSSTEQLNNIIKSMRKVRSVKEVYRVNQ